MLQGVVARGTARAIGALSPYVAGKTGTTEDENDAWFVGFTNDVTVAVWVGYDNADGKRRTLGARPDRRARWRCRSSSRSSRRSGPTTPRRRRSAGPTKETERQLVAQAIDLRTGEPAAQGAKTAFVEHFRRNFWGSYEDTQHRLVSREQAYAYPPSRSGRPTATTGSMRPRTGPMSARSRKRRAGARARASRSSAAQAPSYRNPYRGHSSRGGTTRARGGARAASIPIISGARKPSTRENGAHASALMVLLAVLSTPALCFGATAEFRVKDVPSATALDARGWSPGPSRSATTGATN